MCKPWWSGSRGHWNEAGIVTANVCTTQSYQAVLTGFHSGMSLKTEKGCLPSSPSPGTCTKGVLWSAQNPLYWFCECLSILLTLKSPVFHFRRHCISSLIKVCFIQGSAGWLKLKLTEVEYARHNVFEWGIVVWHENLQKGILSVHVRKELIHHYSRQRLDFPLNSASNCISEVDHKALFGWEGIVVSKTVD